MKPERLISIVGFTTAVLGAAGCAIAPFLSVPDNSTMMCAGILANAAEPYWFGIPITNSGQRAITLKTVRLGEQDHILLNDALAVPPVQQDNGDMLGIGVMRNPATEEADLWAGRQSVAGYMIPPETTIHLALALSRDKAETGRARSQIITYRVDGDVRDRETTSRLELVVTTHCETLDEFR